MKSVLEIPKEALRSWPMNLSGSRHILSKLVDCVSKIRMGERQVLHTTNKIVIGSSIGQRKTIRYNNFGGGRHMGNRCFNTHHASLFKKISNVFMLRQKEHVGV